VWCGLEGAHDGLRNVVHVRRLQGGVAVPKQWKHRKLTQQRDQRREKRVIRPEHDSGTDDDRVRK
jgi:hypothetical protein